ncbi:hypothetical protein HELRODRAFT_182955 [Helobdella robusta]|uniref:RRM domain-containing protein n=1 Tax=Helobdella robusta TaxID=6412 RepID=T1FIZ5_HELRO|nr:hypothetical protein HELRODRAFT_182955 [Helobdella robusta]ESN89945.1 hypothetical protein HELRODRAFT_182955 [Helobdella robusta]
MSSDKEFGNNHANSGPARCLELTSQAHGEFTDVAVGGAKEASTDSEDAQVKKMKERNQRMEDEIKESELLNKIINTPTITSATSEVDGRSIWVGNVDYGATLKGLNKHFEQCGSIHTWNNSHSTQPTEAEVATGQEGDLVTDHIEETFPSLWIFSPFVNNALYEG